MIWIKDMDLIKDINILYNHEVVLYGAGNYGKVSAQLMENAGVAIRAFCDSASVKWGKFYCENRYLILSPMELKELVLEESTIVIITIEKTGVISEVLNVLKKCGIENLDCYTWFALKFAIEFHINDPRIPVLFREKVYAGMKAFRNFRILYSELLGIKAIYNVAYRNAILVFQPAKVGSSTICASLDVYQINNEHIHYLMSERDESGIKDKSFELQEAINLLTAVDKIKIITLVREPISRDIAEYFQLFYDFTLLDEQTSDTCQGVLNFLNRHLACGTMGYEFEWFNKEIKEIFGVDIYNYYFDRDAGYGIIKENAVEILVLKMEKLNECQEAIGQFVGVRDFKLITTNVGEDKRYGFTYKDLKQKIKIPQQIIKHYYQNNPGMDFFYTSSEKALFLERWKNNMEGNCDEFIKKT